MTALPRRQYRDPLEQLLEAEEESCKGCRWRTVRPGNPKDFSLVVGCDNPRAHPAVRDRRCDEYEDNA